MKIENLITKLLLTSMFGWCLFALMCGIFFSSFPNIDPSSPDAIVHDTAPLVTAISFYICMLNITLTVVWFVVISVLKEI